MKVFVALLSTILLVSAIPTGKQIIFNEDGSFSIQDQTLRQITFVQPLGVNQHFVEVVINAATIPRKSIVLDVNYQQYGNGYQQVGQLVQFFLPYRNQYIDQQVYNTILNQVQIAVQNNQISPVIYAALQAVDNQELFGQLILGQGVFARETEILGVPVTGELVNQVYQNKIVTPVNAIYGQQYGKQYLGQYYGQQYYPQYAGILSKVFGYGYPQYQYENQQYQQQYQNLYQQQYQNQYQQYAGVLSKIFGSRLPQFQNQYQQYQNQYQNQYQQYQNQYQQPQWYGQRYNVNQGIATTLGQNYYTPYVYGQEANVYRFPFNTLVNKVQQLAY